MSIAIGICLLLSMASCWYVFVPALTVVSDGESNEESTSIVNLRDQRERCLQVLRDLDLDKATGKVTAEEYDKMRASVGRELLMIVDRLQPPQAAVVEDGSSIREQSI